MPWSLGKEAHPGLDHATSWRNPKKGNIIPLVIINMVTIVSIMNIDSFNSTTKQRFFIARKMHSFSAAPCDDQLPNRACRSRYSVWIRHPFRARLGTQLR